MGDRIKKIDLPSLDEVTKERTDWLTERGTEGYLRAPSAQFWL